MNADLPMETIVRLKDILRDVSEARAQLHENLSLLEKCLAATPGTAQSDEYQRLQQECAELRRQNASARDEVAKAKREYRDLRRRLERAVSAGIRGIYRALDRDDPFTTIRELRKQLQDADTERRRLAREKSQLECRTADLEQRLQDLNGLANRYKDEIANLQSQLEASPTAVRKQVLQEVVQAVTPRRLAQLMDADRDSHQGTEPDQDAGKVLGWLTSYLRDSGVRVLHRQGDRITLEEKDLYAIRLDEPFREGGLCEVIAPGFLLGENVLVKSKARYLEDMQNGPLSGCSNAAGKVPGSPESPSTG